MTNRLSMRQRMLGDSEVTSCLRTRRELQRYLDGESDPSLAERIASHLDACRACGLEAETYRAIKTALNHRADAPTPEVLARLTSFAAALPRGRHEQ